MIGGSRYARDVSGPIVSIDWSHVHEGKLEELRLAMQALVAFVDANETRPLAYEVFFSEDGSRMTVVQVHPDSASMEFHMRVAAAEFAKVQDLLTLSAIEIYGAPSEALVTQMRRKAHLLGGATLAVHDLHAGFTRFGLD
jgi:quinol monooxygenase YgiN